MTIEETHFTVGKTTFYQGENQTYPLFRVEAGIPCQAAREQASELMGYVRDLSIDGLMEDKPQLLWASYYLSALANWCAVRRAWPTWLLSSRGSTSVQLP